MIIGEFVCNGILSLAIIDTGATASFVSDRTNIVKSAKLLELDNPMTIKTADHRTITANQTINTTIRPLSILDSNISIDLYILPNRTEIMGYPMILGIDAIKALNAKIESRNSIIIAHINEIIIAEENRLKDNQLATITTEIAQHIQNYPNPFDQLIEEYADIFAESANSLIDTTPMTIPLSTALTAKARLRPHSVEDILEIERQVQKLIDNDIVEPSESDFSANVHLVPKKNGQRRMVVDFRSLNDIAVKDHYPLPQMSNMFRALRDATHFAALDCTEGFLQIPVDINHRHKTAFITEHGSFQYKRCPFGFTNSPAKFQRTMNEIFDKGLYRICVIYIDDILVFGKSEDELLNNLKWIFKRCRNKTVKLKKSKCKFNVSEVEFLGFKISNNTVSPVLGKYDPICLESPTTKTDVRAILGAFNHYARFIPNYANLTAPIRKLTHKNVAFKWTQQMTDIVKQLKETLNKAIPEKIADSYSQKYVTTTITQTSIEVTCFDEENALIGRAGSTLSETEKNYTSVELQLLAIVLAYSKFGPILKGPVTIRTTNKGLEPSLKMTQRTDRVTRMMLRLPPDISFNIEVIPGRSELETVISLDESPDEIFYTDGACIRNGKVNCQASWAVLATMDPKLSASGLVQHSRLSNQVAEIQAILKACDIALRNGMKYIVIVTDSKYASGAINKWIDAWKLNDWKDNRGRPVINQELLKQLSQYLDQLQLKCIHVKGHSTDLHNIKVDRMAKEVLEKTISLGVISAQQPVVNQTEDPEIQLIKNNLEADPELQDKYVIKDDELYYIDHNLPVDCRERLFAPKASRKYLLKVAHDDPLYGGHLGRMKTKHKLMGYYWPKMGKDVATYIDSCLVCQRHKASRKPKAGLLQPIYTSKVFEQVHVDIVGPMTETSSGNIYIITAIDAFSRYCFAKAVKEIKTSNVVDFLNQEIFMRHGLPERLVSDNGPQFVSAEFQEFINKLGIKHNRTCDYHPQANGMDERLNGTLVKIIRNYISTDQSNWDKILPSAVFIYNTSIHESTQVCPYAILYGFMPRSPLKHLVSSSPIDINDEQINGRHDEIRQSVDDSNQRARERYKRAYDKGRVLPDFEVLDLVRARSHNKQKGLSSKLQPKWDAPCVVTKVIRSSGQPVALEITNLENNKRRRTAFQDVVHLETREGNRTPLPGELILEVASAPESQAINQAEIDSEASTPSLPMDLPDFTYNSRTEPVQHFDTYIDSIFDRSRSTQFSRDELVDLTRATTSNANNHQNPVKTIISSDSHNFSRTNDPNLSQVTVVSDELVPTNVTRESRSVAEADDSNSRDKRSGPTGNTISGPSATVISGSNAQLVSGPSAQYQIDPSVTTTGPSANLLSGPSAHTYTDPSVTKTGPSAQYQIDPSVTRTGPSAQLTSGLSAQTSSGPSTQIDSDPSVNRTGPSANLPRGPSAHRHTDPRVTKIGPSAIVNIESDRQGPSASLSVHNASLADNSGNIRDLTHTVDASQHSPSLQREHSSGSNQGKNDNQDFTRPKRKARAPERYQA